jgi:pimeloyl-ACP methyl ester carboxylesterase
MKKIIYAILIIIVAIVVGYYAFPGQVADILINAERSKAGLAKKEIKVGDHNISYLEGGKGPAILLLHGYAAGKDNWLRFAAYLTKDFHVIIPDIPGYGESSKLINAKYDSASQVSRLHEFARAINLDKFHIAGNSMGGWFSGVYAVRYPEEILSVGLFDAAGVKSLKKSEVMEIMEKGENPLLLKDENDLSRFMKLIFVNPPVLPYPLKVTFVKQALADRSFNEKTANDMKPDHFASLEKDLPKIKAPTLIVWGDKDKIIDISSVPVFEKGLKNHQTVIIKDCGHAPMLEKPQETAIRYLDFIKGIKN